MGAAVEAAILVVVVRVGEMAAAMMELEAMVAVVKAAAWMVVETQAAARMEEGAMVAV